jgi:hypothetical protein
VAAAKQASGYKYLHGKREQKLCAAAREKHGMCDLCDQKTNGRLRDNECCSKPGLTNRRNKVSEGEQ